MKTLASLAKDGPDLKRETAGTINTEMSAARDALYRAGEVLEYGDPVRQALWELAGEIEDAKIVLLQRCHECRAKAERGREPKT